MNLFLLAWRRLCYKPGQNILAIAVMSLSIAFALLTMLLSNALHQSIVTAGEPFPIVIGAKGSPNQLLLNTVFLKDMPMNNIEYKVVEALRQNKLVDKAVPLAYGDNYRGRRIVGTEPEIFAHKVKANATEPWLTFAQGRAFQEAEEAVLGAQAAAQLNLKLGDTFTSAHGVVVHKGMKEHTHQLKVVGILKAVHGPYDDAILVPIQGIWELHDRQHKQGDAASKGDVTAILVQPTGYSQAMQLAAGYAKSNQVQVLFPAKQIIELFNIMGGGEKLLAFLSYGALGLALLIIACSLYWLITTSTREQGILRALGASQNFIIKMNTLIGVWMVLLGVILGTCLGHGLFYSLSCVLRTKAGLYLPMSFTMEEGCLLIGVVVIGSICSLLPAYLERNKEIIQALQ